MAILVIGGTGQIGSAVVAQLARHDVEVIALGTKTPATGLPASARLVIGDVLDVDFMRGLLRTVSTVFFLNPGVPDELARGLLVAGLVEEAGIKGFVYLSMIGADRFVDSSRAAAKLATEHSIARRHLPATILRPNALFQNDLLLRDAIVRDHRYSTPLGDIGLTMIDLGDLAEVAAAELIRRERAPEPLPAETIDVVGPELFSGEAIAALWSDVLGERVAYAGDDLDAVEQAMRAAMPAASAYDLRLVFEGILREGGTGALGAASRLERLLGRPLRHYRSFAEEMARSF